MMLYNINISYTENSGTSLYGYLPGTNFFGSSNYESADGSTLLAPDYRLFWVIRIATSGGKLLKKAGFQPIPFRINLIC